MPRRSTVRITSGSHVVLHVPSVACASMPPLSQNRPEKSIPDAAFSMGANHKKTDGSLCFFAQMHEKTHVFRANAARSGSTRTERQKEGAPQPIFRARLTAELRSGCRAMGASEAPCARREILRERPAGAAFPSLDRDASFPARGQDSRVPARPLRTPGRLSGRKAASCR